MFLEHPIILASTSARRKELLSRCQIDFVTAEPHVDEQHFWLKKRCGRQAKLQIDQVITWVEDLAVEKAQSVQATLTEKEKATATIIGADTLIFCEGEMLGKPKNAEDAVKILQKLSGRTHQVITGVALVKGESHTRFNNCSEVRFYPENRELIAAYVQTKSPLDKAGAYGIQDMGALLIEEIKGDYYAIMGLPISQLYRYLRKNPE